MHKWLKYKKWQHYAQVTKRFIDYFDCIYLLELKLTDTTNTARSTSYLERYFLIIEMISILTL